LFRASDEDKVRRTLDDLATIVAVKDGDTLLSRLGRLRSRMKDVVEDDVRVNVAELNIDVSGRKKLEEDAAKAGLMFQSADCAFTNLTIRVDPGGTIATVDGLALVTANRGGERKVDKRDVHFLLRKDGAWKVSTIDVATVRQE
jgi:hypothetical protein